MLLAAFTTLVIIGLWEAWNVGLGPLLVFATPLRAITVPPLRVMLPATRKFGPLSGPMGDARFQDCNWELVNPTPPLEVPNVTWPVVVLRDMVTPVTVVVPDPVKVMELDVAATW
jgi:hypothetical protein